MKTCVVCGKEIPLDIKCYVVRKTCGDKCKKQHWLNCSRTRQREYKNRLRAGRVSEVFHKVCPQCNNGFYTNTRLINYCSTECRRRSDVPPRYTVKNCPTCGKEFRVPNGVYHEYCIECRGVYHNRAMFEKKCFVCERDFKTTKGYKVTCSVMCADILEGSKDPERLEKIRSKIDLMLK